MLERRPESDREKLLDRFMTKLRPRVGVIDVSAVAGASSAVEVVFSDSLCFAVALSDSMNNTSSVLLAFGMVSVEGWLRLLRAL